MKTSEVVILVAVLAVAGVIAVQFLKPAPAAKKATPKKHSGGGGVGSLIGDGLSLIGDIAGAFGGGSDTGGGGVDIDGGF